RGRGLLKPPPSVTPFHYSPCPAPSCSLGLSRASSRFPSQKGNRGALDRRFRSAPLIARWIITHRYHDALRSSLALALSLSL
uniref:Uncharacterized protein n=1 Tax=Anopheles albimanus TaxID=7167 RepID=A0A182FZA8_ANOAL